LQCRAVIAWIIGNQVRILNDPVTVRREFPRIMPLGVNIELLLDRRI